MCILVVLEAAAAAAILPKRLATVAY